MGEQRPQAAAAWPARAATRQTAAPPALLRRPPPPPVRVPQRGWQVAGDRILFKKEHGGGGIGGGADAGEAAAVAALPTLEIISHCLDYAREVERIV